MEFFPVHCSPYGLCDNGVLSLTSRWVQLRTPVKWYVSGVSSGRNLPPPCSPETWPRLTSLTLVRRVGTLSYKTWRHYPRGHTVERGQLVRSSIAVAIKSLWIQPCRYRRKRLTCNAQKSIPSRCGPTSGPTLSWPTMFECHCPRQRWRVSVRGGLLAL